MIGKRAGLGWWLVVGSVLLAPAAARAGGDLPERDLVELGRRLFADPAASAVGRTSCLACHDPDYGFSDPQALSRDDASLTPRRSQPLADLRAPFHWDGAIANLEQLVALRMASSPAVGGTQGEPHVPSDYHSWQKGARLRGVLVLDPIERLRQRFPELGRQLGSEFVASVPAHETGHVGRRLLDAGRYADVFELASVQTPEQAEALAMRSVVAYVASLKSPTAPIDRVAAGEPLVLDAAAERGLALFRTRAGCVRCHSLERDASGRATLCDGTFHNTGVALLSLDARLRREEQRLVGLLAKVSTTAGASSRARDVLSDALDDVRQARSGRRGSATIPLDDGAGDRAFKTPSLRDVARRGPYMHDGSLPTLDAVVRHYVAGCGDDPKRDRRLKPFQASEQDVRDLVAFLEALSTPGRPGLPEQPWRDRGSATRLRLLDAQERPLAHTDVRLEEVGDLAYRGARPGPARTLRTDAEGRLETPVGARTHLRVVLDAGIRPQGGDLVPDVCREATLRFPVDGRTRIVLEGVDAKPPASLDLWIVPAGAEEPAGSRRQDRAPSSTSVDPEPWSLRLTRVEEAMPVGAPPGEGPLVLAVYEGYRPSPRREGLVRLPGESGPRRVTLEEAPR